MEPRRVSGRSSENNETTETFQSVDKQKYVSAMIPENPNFKEIIVKIDNTTTRIS